jgi:hypothetical protein
VGGHGGGVDAPGGERGQDAVADRRRSRPLRRRRRGRRAGPA